MGRAGGDGVQEGGDRAAGVAVSAGQRVEAPGQGGVCCVPAAGVPQADEVAAHGVVRAVDSDFVQEQHHRQPGGDVRIGAGGEQGAVEGVCGGDGEHRRRLLSWRDVGIPPQGRRPEA